MSNDCNENYTNHESRTERHLNALVRVEDDRWEVL